jgi:hypothetical protein
MGINFPNTPTTGQLYPQPPTANLPVYRWDGQKWTNTQITSSIIYISDTPPAGAPVGSLWWESDSGVFYVYYNDGDSTQWVQAAASPVDSTYFLLKTGGTMTGALTLAANPVNPLDAVPKQYSDTKVAKSGDTMTGALTVASDITAYRSGQPTTGVLYLGNNPSTVYFYYDGTNYNLGGGALILPGNPTSALQAAPKQYVDSKFAQGTWTPTDASGAGLVFTGVNVAYSRVGNMVFVYGRFSYPTTSNTANATIGGLPVLVANSISTQSQNTLFVSPGSTTPVFMTPLANTTTMIPLNYLGNNLTNANLSGALITFNFAYAAS